MVFTQKSFEDQFGNSEVLRDNTATIVAVGEGRDKHLLVNGVGITGLTPITKFMAHLPLAFLDHPPKDALVVCFGMGTTYRSLLSWDIPVTAVELVPSVPRVFGFYHADGPELLRSPLSHLVIDEAGAIWSDPGQYDVITIDPPPPVEAAGSSLLYSKGVLQIIRQRAASRRHSSSGYPTETRRFRASVARALKESFLTFVCSTGGRRWLSLSRRHQPLARSYGRRTGPAAFSQSRQRFVEWGPEPTPERQFAAVLGKEISLDEMMAKAPNAPALQDDRPQNEYYAIRRIQASKAR